MTTTPPRSPSSVLQVAGLAEAVEAGRDAQWAVRRFFEALAARAPAAGGVRGRPLGRRAAARSDRVSWPSSRARLRSCCVCLAREEFARAAPGVAGRPGRARAPSRLERLSDADTVALIDDLDRDRPLGDDKRAQLVSRSEGNPLFVEQMLALRRRERGRRGRPSRSRPRSRRCSRPASTGSRSTSFRRSVPLSVVGSEFWREARRGAGAGGRGSAAGRRRSSRSRASSCSGRDASALTGESGFAFRHALIRDAAYESLTKEGRAELHERFATWVEGRYHDRLVELEAELGYHLEQAYRYRTELAPVDDRARSLARRGAARLQSAGRRASLAREDAGGPRALLAGAATCCPRCTRRSSTCCC